MRELTQQEIDFAEHFIASLNASESARIIGCTPQQGKSMTNDPDIQEFIRNRIAELKTKPKIASPEHVLEFLTLVMNNDYKEAKSLRPFNTKDRLYASELLGKRYALFVDKVETKDTVTIDVTLEE